MKASYLVYLLMAVALYNNLAVMGADREFDALNRTRNSNGYLTKYGQAN